MMFPGARSATAYAEVIGDPVSHSKSPLIHRFWFEKLMLVGDYRTCHVLSPELAAYLDARRGDPAWRGCNVTVPHKIAVMALVDDPGNVRGTIGAVNTVLRQPDGTVIGTNTDAAGFFAPLADVPLAGKPVAVVGTGGAAHAVLFALARAGVGPVTLIARSPLKAAALLARFGLTGSVQTLDAPLPTVVLLVNASSLGMAGQPGYAPDLAPLAADAVVYDIVYTPLETPLLAAASAHDLQRVDGLDMLIGQAALAFELFFGVAPPREHDPALRAMLVR